LALAFTGPVGFVAVGLPLLAGGGGMWWMAYTPYRRWRAYYMSDLRLATAPVPLGGTLRARLQVPVSDEQPPNGFQARVTCSADVSAVKGTREKVIWEDETSVSGQPGPDETEVSLSVDLPVQPLPDGRRQMAEDWGSVHYELEQLDWTLEVAASFDDNPDYEATFDLPVTVPDDLDERAADASAGGSIFSPESAAPDAETADASNEDEVYWDVDGGEEADLGRADSEEESVPDEESVAGAEGAFSEPVSNGVYMEGRLGEGLTFSFDHARSPMRLWGSMIAAGGTLLAGFGGFFMLSGKMDCVVLLLPAVLVGGLLLRKAWTMLTHAASIQVANGQIEVKKGPFFLDPPPTRMPCDALADTQVKAAEKYGNQWLYTLSLVKQGSGTSVLVVEGLANKGEAEWMADQIRRAAEQQAAPA
jgi:hypothetical protein